MKIQRLQERGIERIAPGDILTIKLSYVARAQQKNEKFIVLLRDVAFKPLNANKNISDTDFVVVIETNRYPILKVCTSKGEIGYVAAIFFEQYASS
jgi:hypothetical protein